MYSNSLVRMETDGMYISINVEIATEGICRGAQMSATEQTVVLLLLPSACVPAQTCRRACYHDSEP